MSNAQKQTSWISNFPINYETIFIFLAIGLITLTFFSSLSNSLYTVLGYLAWFMFFSVFAVMICYTIYNFGKIAYLLIFKR